MIEKIEISFNIENKYGAIIQCDPKLWGTNFTKVYGKFSNI